MMPKYMLLLHGGESPNYSPQEMQRIVEEYIAWARQLRTDGHMLDGDELGDGGKLIRGVGAEATVTDGPFTETKEAIGGYFLIEAADEAQAVEISKQCPGLRRGGAVQLRPIVEH
jgi:hypothetical protein